LIVDITSEIITDLMTEMPTINIENAFPNGVPTFPLVVVQEISNTADTTSKDTSGFHHSSISIQIDIFTNSAYRETEAKGIRNTIDGVLSDEYGLERDFSGQTPNEDTNVYRYTLRYGGLVDSDRVIYGR
jgi:hypothetical protein